MPRSWETSTSVSAEAEQTVKLLNAEAALLPVDVKVQCVQDYRPTVIVTVGEIVSAGGIGDRSIAQIFCDLQSEADLLLSGPGTEYESLFHHDGALVGGFSLRLARVARQLRRDHGFSARFSVVAQAWRCCLELPSGRSARDLRIAAGACLPAALGRRLDQFVNFEGS